MIDLRAYYLDNVKESDYYYRFHSLIENVNKTDNVFVGVEETENYQFLVYDEIEAIERFRQLCQPGKEPRRNEDRCWFYVTCFYLNACGYEIEEFPHVLSRPPAKPYDFVYGDIRNRALALGLCNNGSVAWDERRKIVAGLTFTRKTSGVAIGETLDQMVQQISTRNARFDDMEDDEKLRVIADLVEALLKVNDKYRQPDYSSVMFDYVNDSTVKALRGQLQCFRHSSAEALSERAAFSDEQKAFLIDFGATVCKAIHSIL